MYLRIKYLRKTLKLSQNDFGAKIEVSRDVINNIEQNRNKNPISEYIIYRICKSFSVNEVWLRTGEGDMFAERQKSPVLDELKKEYNLSENELNLIKGYLELSEDDRKVFVDLLNNLTKKATDKEVNLHSKVVELKPTNNTPKVLPPETIDIPICTPVAAGFGHYADNEIIGYQAVPYEWITEDPEDYRIISVDGDSMSPKFENNDLLLVKRQDSVDSGTIAVVLIDGENAVVKKVVYGDSWIELVSINPQYHPRRFEGEDVLRLRIFGVVERCI